MLKNGIVWHRWQRALSGYWDSGLSFAEYCRKNDLNVKAASKWRIRFQPEPPLEIVHLPMPSAPPPVPAPSRAGSSGIKLELGRIGIILDTDFNVEALQRVLAVLEVR